MHYIQSQSADANKIEHEHIRSNMIFDIHIQTIRKNELKESIKLGH